MSLLGLDIGTSGCKAGAISVDGVRLAFAYREYPTCHPASGYCELDSQRVWSSIQDVIRQVAAAAGRDPVQAISISSLGEAMVPVSRDRRLLGPSILSSDVRGAEYIDRLRAWMPEEAFYTINGNLLGPQYSLPKLLWLRDHQPDLFTQADYFLMWGPMAAFMLGCEAVAFDSLASRTLLLDMAQNDWSDSLLGWAALERSRLGKVVCGGTDLGTVSRAAAEELGLSPTVRIIAGGHDQCCNALGCGAIQQGQSACGIGSFECLTPVYGTPGQPLAIYKAGLNIERHVLPGLCVSFLFNQAGTLVKWFRDTFAAGTCPPVGVDLYEALNQEMPEQPTRLLVLPCFEPTAWPRVISDASGVIMGLKTSTQRGEILKAIMEGATFYFCEGIHALGKLGVDLRQITATGGGAKSDRWLQIKADIFGIPVVRPRMTEAGVNGAAMLAGLATKAFASPQEAVSAFVQVDRSFEPDPGRHRLYQERLALSQSLMPTVYPMLQRL